MTRTTLPVNAGPAGSRWKRTAEEHGHRQTDSRSKLPWCGVCEKPVDSIEVVPQLHVRKILYIVRCHDEEERTVLGLETIEDSFSVETGIAFITKRIKTDATR